MRPFFTTLLVVTLLFWGYLLSTSKAEQEYKYKGTDYRYQANLLERKKGKGKKGGKKKPKEEPTVTKDEAPDDDGPLCNPPLCEAPCVIEDPILPDEICNNDCPQDSECHCEGRHDTSTHVLFAVCAPD